MLLSLLVAFSLAAVLFESGSAGMGPRAVAVLGVIVATNSVLRFAEVALPGPGGFSPVFVLIVLSGFAYGARFGFLSGALTMVLSAIVTGGVGPWLPYQMLAAGWVGLTAGWLPSKPGPGGTATRLETAILAAFAGAWGLLYGAIMTLWFWPYLEAGGAAAIDGGPTTAIHRFLAFYLTTSLPWDVFRAGGNVLLMVAVGAPVLGALRRFGRRFQFTMTQRDPKSRLERRGLVPVGPKKRASGSSARSAGAERSVEPPQASFADPSLHPRGRYGAPAASAINPRTWVAWLLAVTALASITRNPLVIGCAAAAVVVVRSSLTRIPERESLAIRRFGAVVIPVAALYSFLTAHTGDTVVVRLPSSWPVIGGPLTIESLVFGLLTGTVLVLLFSAFAVFRQALSARDLVRLVPRAFGALALVGAIALTYVPSVLKQLSAVREAQAIRGLHAKGIRDLVPLAVPLLVGGLERSMHLAESMAARGLLPESSRPVWGPLLFLAGMAMTAAGWLASSLGLISGGAGLLLGCSGAALAILVVVALGRSAPFVSYQPTPWRTIDTIVAVAAWIPLAVAVLLPAAAAELSYSPYPRLALPGIHPALAAAMIGLAAPALPALRSAPTDDTSAQANP
jgi:energy-coupling factor transporter transmembrane protein EcfT